MMSGPSDGDCALLEEEVPSKQSFEVEENTYETVEYGASHRKRNIVIRNNSSKKCLVAMSCVLLFTLLVSVSMVFAFPFITIKLKTELGHLKALLNNEIYGQCESFPAYSCATLPSYFGSGNYWVIGLNGTAMKVYCEMERTCGGITGGWTQVMKLDMTNHSHHCPDGLQQWIDTESNIRSCVNTASTHSGGCSSVIFDIKHGQYSKICGKVIAYQYGTTDAFGTGGIDSNYVDGISLTYGFPRSHIWTFAAALDEKAGLGGSIHSYCPCIGSFGYHRIATPSFVGNDYFCDTGGQYVYHGNIVYSENPLWDGRGCGRQSTCCSFNTPPWFYKQLLHPSTDDIEMRVCRDEGSQDENIAVEVVEIYVQ